MRVILLLLFNTCEDIREYTLEVPELQPSFGEITRYVCNGSEVEFNGKVYTEPGVYIDTLQSIYGCDSILQLTLEPLVAETIRIDTTICSVDLPFVWLLGFDNFERIDSSGIYERGISSSLGCDSLYYILDLEVLESLVIKIDEWPKQICADDDLFEIGYNVLEGKVSGYSIRYSPKSKDVGFEDVEVEFEEEVENVVIDLPEGIRPDKYDGVITFNNMECGNAEVGLSFDVLYPDTIIAQRWNDVLALKNSEYNGGYEFISYQWFLNGQPLEGYTTSQYYTGLDLDFEGEYQLLLTRADDGISAFTCSIVPTKHSQEELENIGVLVFTSDVINVDIPKKSKCYLYNTSGLLYSVYDLQEGMNFIEMPSLAGIYIMKFDYLDGNIEIRKVVISD